MKALIAAINIMAPYVDTIALCDIAIIKMAGFEATFDPSQNKPGVAIVQSLTLVVENNSIEQLTSDCEKFPAGTNRIIVQTNKNRKKVYQNLISGLYYYCTYFGIVKGAVSAMSVQVKKMYS